MKEKKKIHSPYKRKIHIDGEEWTYRITSQTIQICSPDRTKKWKFEGFFGKERKFDEDADDNWVCVGYDDETANPLPPSDVKRIIQKRILNQEISR